MKNYKLFLTVVLLLIGTTIQAQWYFETAIVDGRFTDYTNNRATSVTDLETYGGVRDLSFGIGHLFSFDKKPNHEMKEFEAYVSDYKSPWFQVGVGIGFDQLTLKTNLEINGGAMFPSHYDMAQLHGRLGVYLMPTLFKIKDKPLQLNLSGALVYNLFTNATQSNINRTTNLKADSEFDNSYPAYALGAGLNFFLNRSTRLYAKYEIEKDFGLIEKNPDASVERYSLEKQKISVGLLVDFKLNSNIKKRVKEKTNDLEDKLKTIENEPDIDNNVLDFDVSAFQNRVATLEKELNRHKYNNNVVKELLGVRTEAGGFKYFVDLKYILFRTDSASFDESVYKSQLIDVAIYMSQNPTLTLDLIGYADRRGSPINNEALSLARGKSVYDFLVELGVDSERMKYFGGGETSYFGIDQLEGNRRTEIIVREK